LSTSPDQSLANLVYLYCIVESETAAHRLLWERRVPGLIDDEPLFPVEASGLVAAVSYVPASSFADQPLNALVADLKRLTPYAVRHQAAIGAVYVCAPATIPLGFGSVYHSQERVATTLDERAHEFGDVLNRVRGRHEWGVRVTANQDLLRQHAETASAELRRMAVDTASATRGRAYLLGKQRERLVEAEAERLTGETLMEIVESLAATSDEARQDNLPANQNSGQHRLVLKAAFLVKAARAEEFRSTALALAQALTPRGLALDVTGPWAPYSFVSAAPVSRSA
jgi:hypothetical protein